jgi:hypothetical protein
MTKASQIQSGAKSPHSKTLARISEPSEVFLHRNYMKLRSYRDDLLKRLNNSEYAAEYLAQTLASGDSAGFLVALKMLLMRAVVAKTLPTKWVSTGQGINKSRSATGSTTTGLIRYLNR